MTPAQRALDAAHPTGTPPDVDRWWEVGGEAEAVAVGRDMVARLQDRGIPLFVDLLDRDRLLEVVRDGDLGVFTRARTPGFVGQVEAALLTDRGPSPQLDELLDSILQQADASQTEHALLFSTWARERAARLAGGAG